MITTETFRLLDNNVKHWAQIKDNWTVFLTALTVLFIRYVGYFSSIRRVWEWGIQLRVEW